VAVPGIAIHPTGVLVYEPFLTGTPPAAPPATGIRGGIDIRDAHSGQLRLRLYLPEAFAMLNTDVDGLHGGFFHYRRKWPAVVCRHNQRPEHSQLANVPLGIGTLSPSSGSAAGGSVVVFQSGITAMLGGKSAPVSLADMNMVVLTTPAVAAGPQQLVLTNPDGETVSPDDAFTAQ
jgi:hypothetical protein